MVSTPVTTPAVHAEIVMYLVNPTSQLNSRKRRQLRSGRAGSLTAVSFLSGPKAVCPFTAEGIRAKNDGIVIGSVLMPFAKLKRNRVAGS